MKHLLLILLAILFLSVSCQKTKKKEISIIPLPQEIIVGDSYFEFNQNTFIEFNDKTQLQQQTKYFIELIENSLGLKLNTKPTDDSEFGNKIHLILNNDQSFIGDEDYKLEIKQEEINISAISQKGIFYGLQSLFQLVLNNQESQGNISIPTMIINDHPNFKYRGMHLDVGRHMFPSEFIKKYIDLLAFYKFNTFHWHLTEDQGWRIEIKKYPKLTEVGAWRDQTLIGHGGIKPFKYDGKKYGGFYTQNEIKEIVKYAAERQITIIPEIEMPGHSLAALTAYPELGCTGGPYKVATRWGVFDEIYCSKEETFEFLENVLLEVMDLFPSKYIHIGGDEAPKTRWKECNTCQAVMKKEGLKNEHELQSYFIQRMEKFLNKHGRNIIGWDEILEGGLAPNATVMSWRGTDGGIAAALQNHDAIMTPGSHCYFDHYQSDPKSEPLAIGGFTNLEKVYSYNPMPDTLNDVQAKHILGAQGNVWTEYMETPEYVEYMVLPRMAALSEVNWTNPNNKKWKNFEKRIQDHYLFYKKLGYNYCDHAY